MYYWSVFGNHFTSRGYWIPPAIAVLEITTATADT